MSRTENRCDRSMTQSNLSKTPKTIPAAFAEICRTATDRVAMQMKVEKHYKRYTYTEMSQQIQSLAIDLIQLGIHPGSRVAIISENRPEWVIAYLGIVTAGGTAVPLDIQLTEKEILSLLEQSGSPMVVASDQTRHLFRSLPPQTRLITLDSRTGTEELVYEELVSQGMGESLPPVHIHPQDIASLLYTSGTTGKPKGVALTHRNLLSNAQAMVNSGLGSRHDNFLLMLPLHHAYPFMIACLVPLLMGAKVTLLQSLKGPDLVQCVQETRITMLVGVPQVFAMIRRAVFDQISRKAPFIRMLVNVFLAVSGFFRRQTGWNLGKLFFKGIHQRFGGSLRLLCSGGAKLEPEVAMDFERLGFTILQGYGLTETSPVVTFTPLNKPKLPSVGVPLPDVTVRIANPDAGGIGEIIVSGPNVMAGYDHNPEATGEAIRDGWFHTGDLGYLDQEGYLFLTGRSKEVIVTGGGKNIYPEELEKEYQTSPAIAEICLMSGDLIEEGHRGIHAIILPDFEFLKTQRLLDVPQHLKYELTRIGMTLPPYKRITGISLVKEPLPRTRLGKIKRHKVLALLEKEPEHGEENVLTSVMEQEALATETVRRVVTTLKTFLPKTKPIRLEDHLDLDLGLDSLRRVEILASLEQQFGPLPDSIVTEVITVKDLIEKIKESVKEPTEGTAPRLQSWEKLLEAPPPSTLSTRLLQTPSVWQRWIETVTRKILWIIGRVFFRLEVNGLDHLPRQGPFVLVSNHVSHIDPFIILTSVPPAVFDRTFTFGWEPYFRGWIGRFFAWIGHVIPIGPDSSLVTALQTSATGLGQGKALLIFPEGERSLDGRLLEFRKGVGILACELTVPVVPAWIEGTYQVLPVGARWPRRHPVSLKIGKPFTITANQIEGWNQDEVDSYEAATRLIQEQVLKLAK
ncbi:MAG: AMP-binding protein [Nitrospirales bacterium]|nr:AMP-binding protein [Nitrospirales bacterium]